MGFLKKVILAIIAFVLILWGGSGTQASSLWLQGGGFIGLIAGIIIIYIFGKMASRAMGCLPSLIILAGIIGFIIYAIGGFEGGIHNVGRNIKRFLGQSIENTQNYAKQSVKNAQNGVNEKIENISDSFDSPKVAEETETIAGANIAEENANKAQIRGVARVINADTLLINGYYVHLYGIDSPELSQYCANSQGRSYRCGVEAANWLKGWINGYNLDCSILQENNNRHLTGKCALGPYDIGAALINAGWAVADRGINDYKKAETSAKQDKRGLWSGSFYMPWVWKAQLQQKPAKKSFFDWE